ncbi:MAG: thioesterase family protein [Chitinophagales bacterium]
MEKLEIELPEKFLFSTEMEVRANDINYAGHLGNVQIIGLLDEARVRFFRWLGYDEADVEGSSSIMGDMSCQFKGEAFWGDTLIVEVTITAFFSKAYRVVYRIRHADSDKEVANAFCTLVTFDYKSRKVVPVPEAFKKRMEKMLEEL